MNKQTVGLPLFYETLVPFEASKHAELSLPKQADDYFFAAKTNIIPVLVNEVSIALHHYPLLFVNEKNSSTPTLVAMVGTGDGKNLFVDAKGQWRKGAYIPAWVRRYPFMLLPGAEDNGLLALDTQAAILKPGDNKEKLLDAEGKPTKVFQQVIDFQKMFLTSARRTEMVVKSLSDAGLLEESGLTLPTGEGDKTIKIQGFMVVSEKKLRTLPSDALEKLQKADALGLAYAQLFSMNSIKNLHGAV